MERNGPGDPILDIIGELDPTTRNNLARRICVDLDRAVPGSFDRLAVRSPRGGPTLTATLVGWDVPNGMFSQTIERTRDTLEHVGAVESFRSDPDRQQSAKRRLFFVRFRDAPLFWRLDLAVYAQSGAGDEDFDSDNLAAPGSDWSLIESVLANAVAESKAHLRQNDGEADALLQRADTRVSLTDPPTDICRRVLALVNGIEAVDPQTVTFCGQSRKLADSVLGDPR